MIEVVLNWTEVASAAREGVMRRVRAMANGRELPGGWDEKRRAGRWDNDVESACAERAVAKALNLYWPESPDPDYHGDLPGGRHVRSTDREDGCLLIYPSDPDEGKFLLIIGQCPRYRLVGWLYGREAKVDEFWDATGRLARPAFRVPRGRLREVACARPA